jgi:hypothetical protein
VPVVEVQRTAADRRPASSTHHPSSALHVPSMEVENLDPVLVLRWLRETDEDANPATPQTPQPAPFPFALAPRPFGRFRRACGARPATSTRKRCPRPR